METRRMTRSLREQQSAYEDRARDIQERISVCRDAFRDARNVLDDLCPKDNDSSQRKDQLSNRITLNILQLQAHAGVYDALVMDWDDLVQNYNIEAENSDWAESMRIQRAQFLSRTPHLAEQFQDLIATYEDYHRRVEGSASTEANVSTDTTASRSANGETNPGRSPANSAGANLREAAAMGVPDPANSAGMDDPERTPTRPIPDTETIAPAVQEQPARRVRIRERSTEIDEFGDLSLRSEAASDDEYYYDASPVPPPNRTTSHRSAAAGRTPTSTPLSSHRSPIARRPAPVTHGLFAHTDGLVTNAAPMAWQNHHTGNGRHHETRTYDGPNSAWTDHARAYDSRDAGSRMPYADASQHAASAAPAARAANSAAGSAGNDAGSAYLNPSQPARFADDRSRFVEHRDRLRHVLRDARPPAGVGRYSAPTSAPFDMDHAGPPPAERTTQPPDSSAYNRPRSPPPQPPPVDYGVDFARENASKFYRNGTHMRVVSTKPSSLVLKEPPIPRFNGDYRSYPMFRSRFLKTVGERIDLDPSEKFQFLTQYLDGEPLRMANSYVITDTNYFKLLDRLEDKYGDSSILATLLVQDFNKVKPVGHTSRDLHRFHEDVLHLTDQMEQLGQDVNANPYWRHTLLSKMPLDLRNKISERTGKDNNVTPIQEILACIFQYARLVERNEAYTPWTTTEGNSGRNGQLCRADPRNPPHRAGTYATEADATHAANASKGRCVYCGRDHWASKCTIYTTLKLRLKRLRQLGVCFLCLKGGHWTGTCPLRTNEACKYCNSGQHHQSICRLCPGLRPPTASSRRGPVRATSTSAGTGPLKASGGAGPLKVELTGSSSSAQDVREVGSPVNRTDATGASPANPRSSSTHQRSATGASNSTGYRRRKSKGPRTDPQGRNGTTRPTTACIDENVNQTAANACGSDGLLPDHASHLTTDRRSNPVEVRCLDSAIGASSKGMIGIPDVSVPDDGECETSDEEASLPESTGHCSDAETEPPAEELWADDPSWFATIDQDYSGYAVSTTSPADNHAVLLECLKTTAVNIDNGTCRSVIVFFDSGSNASYISMKLALELQLPCLEKRYFRVNTFGTDVTTTISGFATTLLLRSSQGYTIQLALTASDRIVPPVTTALVTTDEVAQLETSHCALISTRETPDLLIGQDLMHLFQRRFGPSLPNGFQVVWSCLGPMLGGAGKVAHNRRAATTINAATTSDPEPPSDATTTPPSAQEPPPPAPTQHLGYNPEDPLNLWTIDDPAPDPANSAGTETEASAAVPANSAGTERDDSAVVDTTTLLCSLLENNDADLFGDFSRVENAGIGTSEMTPDDQAAADMLKKIHKRQPDGRYEVPLLFRTPDGEPPSNDDLPTNVALAKGRSFSTRKMLTAHPKKLLDYHSVILDWQARGFIKEAPKTTQYTKHFLSHHPVFKETSTTTATRPVYDASAKLPGRTCLNDWLYRGPVALPDVPAILLRSRPPKIVVLADISKAFLQMEVKASHKDCLRFYWFRDPFKEPTDDNIIEYRFERVPFGLKSAPYLLAGVIQLHLESIGTPLALEMLKNCYVDNVLLTADTVREALAKYREAKEIFAQIGMPLREFASNSAEFNAAVDPADRADLTKLKELGIRWDILSDYWDIPLMPKQALPANSAGLDACLAASSEAQGNPANSAGTPKPDSGPPKKRKANRKKRNDGRLTKRVMLRLVARIFDPQGLVQAATLLLKLVIQEAWKLEKDWDDEITGELADLWNEAIKDFDSTVIRVPRRIAKDTIKSVEIHVFTDGSSYAYGFTAYLRVINLDRTYSTNLVYARARVKPIKDAEKFTIPRMELLGVLLGTRIAAYLHKELLLPVSATYLWSDSTIVLHQVANDAAIKDVWTENRLKEIRRLRDELQIKFRYVPTDDNPADIVSRGLPAAELQQCEKWWHGAPFLALDSSRWPEQPTTLRTKPSPSDLPTELYGSTAFTTLFLGLTSRQPQAQWIRQRSQRKKPNPLDTIAEPFPPTYTTALAVTLMVDAANSAAKPFKLPSEPILPRTMDEKYDRWPRLVRIQYYVVRFVAACLRHLLRRLAAKNKQRRHAPALGFDLSQCLTTLGCQPTLRDLQLVTTIILRKTQLRHPPSPTDRRNLGIFESHGLLYVKGRLGNMKLRPTALTPLYLPREARDTELIILEYHRINGHAGVTVTLANLRMRYWFTKGRSTIRHVLRKYCFACRRESMHPYAVPPWPQLPTSRVTNARPFYCTGLDFFGPVLLRAPNGSGSYFLHKHYVCIFVCMTLRCVHLELCEDLSTDAFLHAFKRFGSRREFPHRILSDNGLSFITAREVIHRLSGRHAHSLPVKRTLPLRKAVSARLAARRMPAPAAFAANAGKQQRRPANSAGRTQQRGLANSASPSAVLNSCADRSMPSDATLTRDEEKLVDFCQRHNIEWQTITELSPWKGGVYERLIGLIKHCLRRSVGNTKPTVVEFLSLLLCAEHTANCRPLSYVADSSTDFFLVRPIDFLIPMLDQEAHQYPLDPDVDDSSPDDPAFIGPSDNKLHAKLIKDLTKGRRLADAFWQSFRDGTLLELRNRGIDARRRQFGEATIQPGDLVLVSETDVPRSEWRLALVLKLLPHSDGLIRSARIRYASTKRETNRSLEHLYPIGQIPATTTACSFTVSRLGLCLTVLISDVSAPQPPATMSDNLNTTGDANEIPTAAALTSSVPISSATFDDHGQIVLADLPSLAAPKPAQDTAVPAHSAGRTVTGPGTTTSAEMPDQSAPPHDPAHVCHTTPQATADHHLQCDLDSLTEELAHLLDAPSTSAAAVGAPGPANSAGRKSPQLALTTSADLHNLPSIATPRRPLFDPFELQMSRARQIMTAMNEKMRIWDGLFAKYRRCLELEAAGRPADRNYAQLDAEMMKRLGTPSFLAAAPRADLQADQEAQTDLDVAHQDAQADADAIQQAIDAAWLQEQAAFWNDVQLTGTSAQDDNPFLQEVAAEEEEEAEPTEEAAPVARGPDPANSAGTVPALRPPANQVPFNSRALLRSKPIASDMPPFPSLDEIEHHVRQFFAMLPEGQEPPVLEPIDESRLYSIVAERAQKFCFIVNRNSLAPQTPTTWDPLVLCNGDGEQDCFHRSLRRLRIIQKPRWICGRLKNDAQLVADMNALLDRFVPSFGHMILLSYAVRMFNGSSNVYAYVDFLTRMLDCTDFDEDLPKLLADRQPYLVGRGTRDPWPTTQDLRTAAKRWTCYCQRAYRDIFTRLSGPILWSPEWMRSKDLPSAARTAFDKMATNAAVVLDAVRQMVYRQYGLKHIQAIRSNTAYEWLPLDNFSDRDLLAENGLLPSKTICFVDQYVFRDFGASLQPRIRLELLSDVDCASMLDTVMNKYPSHEVDRIIWWFGTEYIVDHEQDDYGTVVAFLSHHFATYFGYPEQIVIAPPYAHTRCDSWSMNVLGLLVQKPVLLPHARLIIAPHDLQLWRRDYFPTNAAEADETWPSLHLTENGLLRNPHVAELRKYQLNKYHGLDLWTYYEAFTPTAPMPQEILDRTNTGGPHGDFTEPGIVRVAANSAAPATPSTSTSSTTEATANSAVAEAPARPPISATIAEQNPRVQDTRAATDAASPSVSPATPDAAPPSSADAPAIAAPTANLIAPVTIADVETRIAPLAADVAEMKDALLQIKAALLGPRAPTAPDTTTERDD